MKIFKEEILESIARYFRFKKVLKHISKNAKITLLDLGCGKDINFYNFARKRNIKVEEYFAIDPLINIENTNNFKEVNININLINCLVKKRIPIKNNSVDYVIGLAFLEHINYPNEIIKDSLRILKKDGKAIFTTPSFKAKIILEALSKIGLISRREIKEHKHYFEKASFQNMIKSLDKEEVKVSHDYFEFGMNNLIVIEKIYE